MKREIVGVGWLKGLMEQAALAALDVYVLHRWNRGVKIVVVIGERDATERDIGGVADDDRGVMPSWCRWVGAALGRVCRCGSSTRNPAEPT